LRGSRLPQPDPHQKQLQESAIADNAFVELKSISLAPKRIGNTTIQNDRVATGGSQGYLFSVTGEKPTLFYTKISGFSDNLNLKLYKNDGNGTYVSFKASENPGTQKEEIIALIDRGDYLVNIFHHADADGKKAPSKYSLITASLDEDSLISHLTNSGNGSRHFGTYKPFTADNADHITGFDASKGSTMTFSKGVLPGLSVGDDLSIITIKSKRIGKGKLMRASKKDAQLVYLKSTGELFFNGNGSTKGWGREDQGGLLATFDSASNLSGSDFVSVI